MKRMIIMSLLLLSTGCRAMERVASTHTDGIESPRRFEVEEQSVGKFGNVGLWVEHLLQDNNWSFLNVQACLLELSKDYQLLTHEEHSQEIIKALKAIEGAEAKLLEKWVHTIEGRNCSAKDVVACLHYLAQRHEKLKVASQESGERDEFSKDEGSRRVETLGKMIDAVRQTWCHLFFERKEQLIEFARGLIGGQKWSADKVEECLEELNRVYDYLTDKKNFRQLIIAMMACSKDPIEDQVSYIVNWRQLLRIAWAERLLRDSQHERDLTEIGKCLNQVELVISEALSPIQRAFRLHGKRKRRRKRVEDSLPALEQRLDDLTLEDSVLDERITSIIDELESTQSPRAEDTESSVLDTIEIEEEVDHTVFLERKRALFDQVVQVLGVACNMDNTFVNEQVQDVALRERVKAENEKMRKQLVAFLKPRMVRVTIQVLEAHDGSTEALEEEFNALVLQQQLSAISVQQANTEVKEFEEKKLKNRKALIKKLNEEAQAFKGEHERLRDEHRGNKVLRARLKFLAKACIEALEDDGEDILAQYPRILPKKDDEKLYEEYQGSQKNGYCVIC